MENCQDCGLEIQIEAVKREWWNVVMENEWEWKQPEKKKKNNVS